MIRVPISKEFFEFEQSLLPEFDHAMLAEAHYHDIPYKTFQDIPELLEFKDGHHMQLTATAIFSSTLNRWLMRKEKTDSLCIMGS